MMFNLLKGKKYSYNFEQDEMALFDISKEVLNPFALTNERLLYDNHIVMVARDSAGYTISVIQLNDVEKTFKIRHGDNPVMVMTFDEFIKNTNSDGTITNGELQREFLLAAHALKKEPNELVKKIRVVIKNIDMFKSKIKNTA